MLRRRPVPLRRSARRWGLRCRLRGPPGRRPAPWSGLRPRRGPPRVLRLLTLRWSARRFPALLRSALRFRRRRSPVLRRGLLRPRPLTPRDRISRVPLIPQGRVPLVPPGRLVSPGRACPPGRLGRLGRLGPPGLPSQAVLRGRSGLPGRSGLVAPGLVARRSGAGWGCLLLALWPPGRGRPARAGPTAGVRTVRRRCYPVPAPPWRQVTRRPARLVRRALGCLPRRTAPRRPPACHRLGLCRRP